MTVDVVAVAAAAAVWLPLFGFVLSLQCVAPHEVEAGPRWFLILALLARFY